jgi:hypothetical protein
MSKQPEALRLADWCDANSSGIYRKSAEAAAELRRLHAVNGELRKALRDIEFVATLDDKCSPDSQTWRLISNVNAAITKAEAAA